MENPTENNQPPVQKDSELAAGNSSPDSEASASGNIPEDIDITIHPEKDIAPKSIIVGFEGQMLALTVPPPQVLKSYMEFYPDAAQKFFAWSEEESVHRRKMDEMLVQSQIKDSRLGINYGFLVSLAALVFAGFAVYEHAQWAASIVGGGAMVALARAFIIGKNIFLRRPKKNAEKTPPENK